MGRENTLNIGMLATYIEIEGADPKAFDLDEKRWRLAENKHSGLTVEQLLDMVDGAHIATVGMLQWLHTLVHYIPQLEHLKAHVLLLYRTCAKKLQLPAHATKVHPLVASSKKETITTELKEGVLDFWNQLGQNSQDYLRRLLMIGGDGLTYKKLLQLKMYMQFHGDEFQSFELMEPTLEVWHAEWTALSCGFEAHWGSLLSDDPTTLGHSAHRIDWPEPSNLAKVDFYPASEFTFLVLDVRMLTCWE